jgi:hypothetical protein
MWHGSVSAIPPTYHLCDGTNGTPDLRDKFIVGAGSTYNVNDSGGSLTHTHAFTATGHQHNSTAGNKIGSAGGRRNSAQTAIVTGTTDPADSQPPYYALAYIKQIC